LAGVVPQIPRAVRAWFGGDSAGAAPTPIRAAAHGEPSVFAFSRAPSVFAFSRAPSVSALSREPSVFVLS
jgi:hypothetical protein